MLDFDVTAKQYGDSVKYTVSAEDIKEALAAAKTEARRIFDYEVGREEPTVSVKPVKVKNEEGE